MFGVKAKKITTQNEYSIEELYEAIKDKPFSAGQPALTKHGAVTMITFPPLDRWNQVWIVAMSGFKVKPTNKFQVSKNEAAGVENMAANMGLSTLTRGLTNLAGAAGKKNKLAEQLVDTTVDELNALNL